MFVPKQASILLREQDAQCEHIHSYLTHEGCSRSPMTNTYQRDVLTLQSSLTTAHKCVKWSCLSYESIGDLVAASCDWMFYIVVEIVTPATLPLVLTQVWQAFYAWWRDRTARSLLWLSANICISFTRISASFFASHGYSFAPTCLHCVQVGVYVFVRTLA